MNIGSSHLFVSYPVSMDSLDGVLGAYGSGHGGWRCGRWRCCLKLALPLLLIPQNTAMSSTTKRSSPAMAIGSILYRDRNVPCGYTGGLGITESIMFKQPLILCSTLSLCIVRSLAHVISGIESSGCSQ